MKRRIIMKYKNIIFDFGNVLAAFKEAELSQRFCTNEADSQLFKKLVFDNWQYLDEGSVELSDYINTALSQSPEHLKTDIINYFNTWYKLLIPLTDTWDFVKELKAAGYSVYILSNAPVQFAEHAAECYSVVKEFDGIVFSAPIRLAKPEPEIYQYLFNTYNLKPEDCFFIDDRISNIEAGRALGMDGIVFTGDIEAVKKAIDF